jgi:peptidoglycan-associated lipoprotein
MNKYFKKTSYPFVLLATLPLLVLGGCASQDTTKPIEDVTPSVTETDKPVSEIQDPIVMLEGHAAEFDTENMGSKPAMNEDKQPVASSTEEPVLYPPATRPQEQRIGFAFDQTEVNEQYHELLKQHAQYLAENKDLNLNVNGHTDSFGPREYNKYLSKQRAEAVAKLLVEYGAPEDRIMVEGNADEEPLLSATHQSENRRVELDYQDQRLVSSE